MSTEGVSTGSSLNLSLLGQSGSAVSTYYTTEPLLKILNHVTLKLKRRML